MKRQMEEKNHPSAKQNKTKVVGEVVSGSVGKNKTEVFPREIVTPELP